MTDYKSRHEQFVTGLRGGSVVEIYAVSAVIVLGSAVYAVLTRNKALTSSKSNARLLDFFFNWAVPLVTITLYANKLYYLAGSLVVAVALFYSPPAPAKSRPAPAEKPQSKQPALEQQQFITIYRSCMLILTCLAILAVDFQVFPRRFAKVETWGTALMDLGVGSFVFSMGLVSARPVLKSQLGVLPHRSLGQALAQAFKYSLKLLVLGIGRLVLVKSTNYQEHVSEYGTHWNFFITLGSLPPLVALLERAGRRIPLVLLGLAVAFGYEIVLKNTGLLEWALTAPRVDFISHNREGICSFVGYLAIFIVGESVGIVLLPQDEYPQSLWFAKQIDRIPGKNRKLWFLLASSAIYHALFILFRTETQVSRRLANLPYVLWTCGYNTGLLALIYLVCRSLGAKASPSHAAINSRGQTVFLLSNILTGIVNLLFNTIDFPPIKATALLLCYAAVLYAASLAISQKRK